MTQTFNYPQCVTTSTIYVLRYGETPTTFSARYATLPYAIPFFVPEGAPLDQLPLTDPIYKLVTAGKPIVTTDYGLKLLRDGAVPELAGGKLDGYGVQAFPSMTRSRSRVGFCKSDIPV